jgi:hypothetical protein
MFTVFLAQLEPSECDPFPMRIARGVVPECHGGSRYQIPPDRGNELLTVQSGMVEGWHLEAPGSHCGYAWVT